MGLTISRFYNLLKIEIIKSDKSFISAVYLIQEAKTVKSFKMF